MKKLIMAAIACMMLLHANAQYADIGVHGGFGTTWLINNNISDQGSNLDPEFSTAPVFGVHFNYSLSKHIGVGTEINYAVINQKFKGEDAGYTWTGKDRVNYMEVPVLFRLKSSAFYCEVGPKFSFLAGAKSEFKPSAGGGYTDQRAMSSYKNVVVSAVLGLGGNFQLAKGWYLNAGLRFSWGLTDATRDFSDNIALAPQNQSISSEFAHTSQSGKLDYKTTNIATGHILVGISRRFPY